MRHILGSLVVRVVLVFLAGLVLLLLAIAVAIIGPDGRFGVLRLVSPREAAAVARALEATSAQQQALVVAALDAGPLIVRLQPGFPPAPDGDAAWRAPYLERLHADYAAALEGRPFRMEARGAGAEEARDRIPGGVRLLVGLRTGEVLAIERAPVLLERLAARFALVGGAAGLILLLVMLFCIHQMVLPARRLARASHRLAADIGMPDLPASGPAEMRMLASAFNEMKHMIRGLMDERTRILAAIAHDLRTYLTRLRLRADFIGDADQQARAVRDLDEMSLLLDDTMLFARQATAPALGGTETVDLGREIEAFVRMRREIGDPVDWQGTDGPLAVRCAPLALRRMLANLTDNAVRYGKAAHLAAGRTDGVVEIIVEDEGPGIPADAIAGLMQPFRRLEPSRGRQTGGAGLGLAIVQALARGQGGDLAVENRPGGGLRARIRLPAADKGP
ncbi:ATP-binding protein [Labrys monachus]|uniref:histidine kinase n=1 Tax=Labrys monachus TaxID=217067 RepID=A0ABU0FJZ8_9HYPH|nr:ATP-binding protein [Labrys monachus]MDQ0394851.1 signal transduction histidine kinase [Labrys monachus]